MTKMPKVGDGATYHIGSDSYACTIVQVSKTGKTVWTRTDIATPADGHDFYGEQKYTYAYNPKGDVVEWYLSRRKSDAGLNVYRRYGEHSGWLRIGDRRTYQDPSF